LAGVVLGLTIINFGAAFAINNANNNVPPKGYTLTGVESNKPFDNDIPPITNEEGLSPFSDVNVGKPIGSIEMPDNREISLFEGFDFSQIDDISESETSEIKDSEVLPGERGMTSFNAHTPPDGYDSTDVIPDK